MEKMQSMNLGIVNMEKWKPLLIILGWTAIMTTLTVGTIFQGGLVPHIFGIGGGGLSEVINADPTPVYIFYIGSFLVSVLATLLLNDIRNAIAGYFTTLVLTAIFTYVVLDLPDMLGIVTPGSLQGASTNFAFYAIFPWTLMILLLGTIVGTAIGERYFSNPAF
jgi:hypothetical protein